METSHTSSYQATSRRALSRGVRGLALACALFFASAFALGAAAQDVQKYGNAQQAPQYRTTHHQLTEHSNLPPSATQNYAIACPPGTQRYQGRCISDQREPQHAPRRQDQQEPQRAPRPDQLRRSKPPQYYTKKPNMTPYGVRTTGSSTIHSPRPMMIDHSRVKPRPGVPIEHSSSTGQQHGIIFVGGKNAINSQPVPPGHSALNPQPIPPGHAIRKIPNPGAPLEQNKH